MSPGISTRLLATQSDERLLRLVREGHERAFEALFHRYRKPLLNYCRRLSLPEARTEDVLQQALLKTWIALRDGAEVRDIKAWLYRVVHNAAVNAVRDAAHDRERVADPTLRIEGGHADIERGLIVREALAEVAALPPLQREVIVRTAVGGYSHEQVASDLGLSDGAVRGLLYRARTTLRTATTALTPPQLLIWLAGRTDQGAGASVRVGELAAGGGTVGLGGLLLKGGVAAVTAGTLITGAAVVQLQGAGHRHHGHPGAVTAAQSNAASTSTGTSVAAVATVPNASAATISGGHAPARRVAHIRDVSTDSPGSTVGRSGTGEPSRGTALVRRRAPVVAPGSAPVAAVPTTPTTSVGSVPSGSDQGSSSAGAGGASSGGPVGLAAGAGSSSAAGSEAPPSGGAGSGQQAPSGSEAGGSTPSGGEESSGAQSGSSGSGSSGGEQSGGLVKTVVHEVGNVLEHLLH